MSAPDLTPPGWKPDPLSERLARIEGRFDAVDERFRSVDRRFDAVDQRFNAIDQRFAGIDARLGLIERVMLWGFTINATLSLAILARVLLK